MSILKKFLTNLGAFHTSSVKIANNRDQKSHLQGQ